LVMCMLNENNGTLLRFSPYNLKTPFKLKTVNSTFIICFR
jgi:hypothetical protein